LGQSPVVPLFVPENGAKSKPSLKSPKVQTFGAQRRPCIKQAFGPRQNLCSKGAHENGLLWLHQSVNQRAGARNLFEAGFILQEHEAGTLNAWLVKQSISRGIRWLGKHPIRDCAILRQILGRFPFGADDNGKISTCNECVQSDMDSVVALLKERVPGYVPAKDEYNGLVEDVLANWEYIWNEAIVYNVLATIVYTNEPKKDFGWYDGLKLLHLVDFAAWQQWCDA
jgi:hypothetical protein